PDDAGRCTGADDKLAEVWGPDHRAEVRRAMLATGLPYAEDRWHEVEGRLDAYAREWSEGHHRACDEGDAAMDGRMACLERRRRELGSLVDVLAAADAGVVQQALGAVSQL